MIVSDTDPKTNSYVVKPKINIFTKVKALFLGKFKKFRPDLYPNIYVSCSDPNEHDKQDLDPKKVDSDPQHCVPGTGGRTEGLGG